MGNTHSRKAEARHRGGAFVPKGNREGGVSSIGEKRWGMTEGEERYAEPDIKAQGRLKHPGQKKGQGSRK